jgi:hypothetical protein
MDFSSSYIFFPISGEIYSFFLPYLSHQYHYQVVVIHLIALAISIIITHHVYLNYDADFFFYRAFFTVFAILLPSFLRFFANFLLYLNQKLHINFHNF